MGRNGLEFDRDEEPFIDQDYSQAWGAQGRVGADEVVSISVAGWEHGERIYSVSFDVGDAKDLYDAFTDVVAEDEMRENDDILVLYRDERGEVDSDLVGIADGLPDNLGEISELHANWFATGYSPGLTGNAASNPNLFTFLYHEASDAVYDSLAGYVGALHPDERVAENADAVAGDIQDELAKLEDEISTAL